VSHRLKNWLPAIVWCSLMMLASTDTFSAEHTRGILEGFFHWLFPTWTPYSVYKAHLIVRKCAHFFEYAVLAVFVMRGFAGAEAPSSDSLQRGAEPPLSLRNADPSTRSTMSRSVGMTSAQKIALQVVLICAMVATVDEVHQHFVPSRTASPYDVMLDTAGSTFAMLLLTWKKSSRRGEQKAA